MIYIFSWQRRGFLSGAFQIKSPRWSDCLLSFWHSPNWPIRGWKRKGRRRWSNQNHMTVISRSLFFSFLFFNKSAKSESTFSDSCCWVWLLELQQETQSLSLSLPLTCTHTLKLQPAGSLLPLSLLFQLYCCLSFSWLPACDAGRSTQHTHTHTQMHTMCVLQWLCALAVRCYSISGNKIPLGINQVFLIRNDSGVPSASAANCGLSDMVALNTSSDHQSACGLCGFNTAAKSHLPSHKSRLRVRVSLNRSHCFSL